MAAVDKRHQKPIYEVGNIGVLIARHPGDGRPVETIGARTTLPETAKQHTPSGHCPVLIVEDDADLREMMAQLLALEGYRAEAVANGRAALDYLEKGDFPEVILLDLMMPVMDGWEFRRRQRADPVLAGVPVVVLSALDPSRAADLGGAAFLKKPLDFDRLLEIVREYCPNSH